MEEKVLQRLKDKYKELKDDYRKSGSKTELYILTGFEEAIRTLGVRL